MMPIRPGGGWLAWALALLAASGEAGAAEEPRQFILINCNGGDPAQRRSLDEVRAAFPAPGTHGLALGVAAIFSYLHKPLDQVRQDLQAFLHAAQDTATPVVVQLDGEQWWEGRSDLWNWWDAGTPGFDPANRANVEWTGWGPEYAVCIAWRNWGRQIRVLPPPNLMSPRYRAACHQAMGVLVPDILGWWRALPPERQYLLVAIKLGWESSLGVNSFHYPGGNGLLHQAEQDDPVSGINVMRLPDRGVAALGYAAVASAGLAQGGVLSEALQVEVIRRHLEDLCTLARTLGLPRERIFTHTAGWKPGEALYDAAVNRCSCPGWSFYAHADDPSRDVGVQRALARSDAPWWAAVEWLPTGPPTAEAWASALRTTLAQSRCRFLTIYNWGQVKGHDPAIAALKRVLAGEP